MIDVNKTIEAIQDIAHTKDSFDQRLIPSECKIANIDAAYFPGDPSAPVIFEDELESSGKPYLIIVPGLIPGVGDRVLMLPVGRTYVIAGLLRRKYYRSSTWSRSVANNTPFTINAFAIEIKSINDFGSSPYSAGVFTCPITKAWSFHIVADNLPVSGTTRSFVSIRVNRVTTIDQYTSGVMNEVARVDRANVSIGANPLSTSAQKVWLNAGDTVDFTIFQNSGAAVTVTGLVTTAEE